MWSGACTRKGWPCIASTCDIRPGEDVGSTFANLGSTWQLLGTRVQRDCAQHLVRPHRHAASLAPAVHVRLAHADTGVAHEQPRKVAATVQPLLQHVGVNHLRGIRRRVLERFERVVKELGKLHAFQ